MYLSTLHKPWLTILLATLVIAICMTFFSGIASAQGTVTGSARFYGSAMGDKQGSPVTAEEICAWIQEEEVACGPIQRGKYKIVIDEPEGEDYDDQTIVFTIWLEETQKEIEAQEGFAVWQDGATTQINLIFPGALANAVNKARSAIAGFISPKAAAKGATDRGSGNVQGNGGQVTQMEEQKQRRISEMQQNLESEKARIEQDLAGSLESVQVNYDNELQRLQQNHNTDGETINIQYEIDKHEEELTRQRQNNGDRRYIDELERNIERLNMNLAQAKSRGNSNISREKGNMDRQFQEQKMMLQRDAREQITRMESEMQRSIMNITREMDEQLRQQQSNQQRQQGEQERMRREEEMREEQMVGQMEADERRFEMEEERMERQMKMEEQRMQRDLEMQEERMRMEQDMMQRGGRQGMQGMQGDRGPGPGGPEAESGPPQKRRGFLSNPKPGAKMGAIDNIMDPTMLAMVGIGLTILTTGVTLIRSK
jgi:hypothetical protein